MRFVWPGAREPAVAGRPVPPPGRSQPRWERGGEGEDGRSREGCHTKHLEDRNRPKGISRCFSGQDGVPMDCPGTRFEAPATGGASPAIQAGAMCALPPSRSCHGSSPAPTSSDRRKNSTGDATRLAVPGSRPPRCSLAGPVYSGAALPQGTSASPGGSLRTGKRIQVRVPAEDRQVVLERFPGWRE